MGVLRATAAFALAACATAWTVHENSCRCSPNPKACAGYDCNAGCGVVQSWTEGECKVISSKPYKVSQKGKLTGKAFEVDNFDGPNCAGKPGPFLKATLGGCTEYQGGKWISYSRSSANST
eukprot:gene16587-23172_t